MHFGLLVAFVSSLEVMMVTGKEKKHGEWGYVDKNSWEGVCKTGKSQSPIDLDLKDAVIVHWEPLKFHNYNARGTITAKNNGHTELVEGFRSWTKKPYITGGNLKGRYYLKQFHFHWDGNSRFGSEHTLDSLHYPMEAHLVHIRSDLDEHNATKVKNGIAVVAVQFKIAKKGQPLFDLEKLTMETSAADSKASRRSYTPGGLIPRDTSTFFRYIGSLTTPPCSEGVIWSILVEPNYVTKDQLDILRKHLNDDGSLLISNWRDVQPRNGRILYLNKKGSNSRSMSGKDKRLKSATNGQIGLKTILVPCFTATAWYLTTGVKRN